MNIIKKITIITIICTILLPQFAWAAVFNHNHIITDTDLTNAGGMSVSHIQKFLEAKGALGSYITLDPWGAEKTAAQIIYDAAQYWTISPQYLLVRMQIEQSLITVTHPTTYQLDWATGYGCPDSGEKYDQYKGFFNQINWAARKVRESYLADLETRGMTFTGWGPGITKTVTDYNGVYEVTPVNNATAALYTYTPHVYNANYNIWKFWNQWFAKNYPDGSLLQVEGENGVYIIKNGKKRPFLSRTALVTRYNPAHIIIVTRTELDAYEEGQPIKFANYSLLRSTNNGRTFLIDGDYKRYIESPEIFRAIGFNPEEIMDVPESDLSPYTWGTNINMQSIYPTGVLLQSLETGGISYVENGVRHSIWSKEILQSRFSNRTPVVVEQATIDQYPKEDPIKFKDGELITSPSARGVYVISNGQRRGIASKEAFDTLGFKWENIIWTTDGALNIHPEGEPINIIN